MSLVVASMIASASPQMRQHAENRIQHIIQLDADILNRKPQHEVAVFLQQSVLASITAVGVFVGEVLTAVECLASYQSASFPLAQCVAHFSEI